MPPENPQDTASLEDFLRAQLDADEVAALCATPGPWRADDEHELIPAGVPAWVVSRTDAAGTFLGDVAYSPQRHPQERENAEHIARHDPARVLADVAAKRAILERYERELEKAREQHDHGTDARLSFMAGVACTALEPVVRLLAATYADRPGYRPEWRP